MKTSDTAPYVPFKTFQSALDRLNEAIPHRIDKSVYPTFAYATITQILAAFRFFGLIDENGIPQPELKQLTVKEEARAPFLRKLLEKSYPEVMRLDLTKATPDQVDEVFKKYNVSGATLRKAITFFLQAAQFSKLPMSGLLEGKTKKGATPGTPRKRRSKSNGTFFLPPFQDVKPGTGTSHTIAMKSGGRLTLEVEMNVFSLSAEDRVFVFDLIDRLQKYESENKKETASE